MRRRRNYRIERDDGRVEHVRVDSYDENPGGGGGGGGPDGGTFIEFTANLATAGVLVFWASQGPFEIFNNIYVGALLGLVIMFWQNESATRWPLRTLVWVVFWAMWYFGLHWVPMFGPRAPHTGGVATPSAAPSATLPGDAGLPSDHSAPPAESDPPDAGDTASPGSAESDPTGPADTASPAACVWRIHDRRPPTRVRRSPRDTTVALAELENGTEIHIVNRDGRWVEIDQPVPGWVFDANIACE